MARKISDAERIVTYFQTNIGTPEADTIYNIVRGMYRVHVVPAPATKVTRKRRARVPKATFVQAVTPDAT